MADIIVNDLIVTVDVLGPAASIAVAEAANAEASAAAAAASETAAAGSASDAEAHADAAGTYYAGVLAEVGDLDVDAILPLQAVDRTVLAAFTGMTSGRQAWLGEPGREGIFKWSVLNHAADVTADPLQGIYVPPATNTSGSAGCWVRVLPQYVRPEWWGAARDASFNGTIWTGTNDTPAFRAADTLSGGRPILGTSGGYMVEPTTGNACLVLTTASGFIGAGEDVTTLYVAPVAPGTHGATQSVIAASNRDSLRFEGFSIDVQRSGLGGAASDRVHGLSLANCTNVVTERVNWWNVTGYSWFPNSCERITARTCWSFNCHVSFEPIGCTDVLTDDCHARSGSEGIFDGGPAVPCEANFHAYDASLRWTIRNCTAIGPGHAIYISADNVEIEGVCVEGGHYENTVNSVAVLFTSAGTGRNVNCGVSGARVVGTGSGGMNIESADDFRLDGGHISGLGSGVVVAAASSVYVNGSLIEADGTGLQFALGTSDSLSTVRVAGGGRLKATSSTPGSASSTFGVGITVGDDVEQIPAASAPFMGNVKTVTASDANSTSTALVAGWYAVKKVAGGAAWNAAATGPAMTSDFTIEIVCRVEGAIYVGVSTSAGASTANSLTAGINLDFRKLYAVEGGSAVTAVLGVMGAGDHLLLIRRGDDFSVIMGDDPDAEPLRTVPVTDDVAFDCSLYTVGAEFDVKVLAH